MRWGTAALAQRRIAREIHAARHDSDRCSLASAPPDAQRPNEKSDFWPGFMRPIFVLSEHGERDEIVQKVIVLDENRVPTARGSFHLRIDFSMSNELDQF